MPARVMIKAGIFRASISSPINAPKAQPITSTSGKATSGEIPQKPIALARKTPVKAITDPTDRSIRRRITKVMPTAMIPRKALSVRILQITRVEAKPGNWVSSRGSPAQTPQG